MGENTLAEAANTNMEAPVETSAPETQIPDAVAQHELLAEQLADANWSPESSGEVAGELEAVDDGSEAADSNSIEEAGVNESDSHEDDDDDDDREPAQEPQSKDKGKRFRFSDPADRQFAVLRKEGVPPDEAARIAYGITANPVAASGANGLIPGLEDDGQEGSGGAGAGAGDDAVLAARQQQLRAVDARLLAAGADEGLINGEIIELMRLRSDLAAEIKTEERFQRQAAQAQAAEQARVTERIMAGQREAKSAAMERFPSICRENSAVRQEADRLTRLYGGSELLRDPAAPMQIAEQAVMNVARAQAAALGTSIAVEFARLERAVGAAGHGGKAQSPAKAVAARKITPASGAQATQRPDQPATEQEIYRAVQSTEDPRRQHEALSRLLYGR